MADVLSKIKRFVRAGQWRVEKHALDELAKDEFTLQDVKHGILSTIEFDELTHDDSHVRYRLYCLSLSGRPMVIIVFFRGRSVRIKTAYEPRW